MSDETQRYYPQKLDARTTNKISSFLFNLIGIKSQNESEEQFKQRQIQISRGLEASTIVRGPKTLSALTYYGILRDGMESEAARQVGDVIKRLNVAYGGTGREQGATILRGGLPKEYEVRTSQL
jgi:hypothetical protein